MDYICFPSSGASSHMAHAGLLIVMVSPAPIKLFLPKVTLSPFWLKEDSQQAPVHESPQFYQAAHFSEAGALKEQQNNLLKTVVAMVKIEKITCS